MFQNGPTFSPDFEVRFSVEVCGLDEAHPVGLGGGEKDDVGRKRLLVGHPQDVAHVNLFPTPVFKFLLKNRRFSSVLKTLNSFLKKFLKPIMLKRNNLGN